MLWTKSSRNSVGGGGLRAGLAGKVTLEQTKMRTSPVSDWQRQATSGILKEVQQAHVRMGDP